MNGNQLILKTAEQLKPMLKKIFPQKMLQKVKNIFMERNYQRMVRKGRRPFDRQAYPDGINLIGLVRAEMGLGQSCRLLAKTFEAGKIDYSLYNFQLGSELLKAEDHSLDSEISELLPYNMNLIHINPDEMMLMYHRMGPECWDGRYNIAFWLWELEEIPEHWKKYFPMLDEIWTPSEFISRNLRKVTDLPVYTMPYCVEAPVDEQIDRTYFKLPEDQFLFLVMYDSNSTIERKNPTGAIRAFRAAFKNNPDVGLILKINNAKQRDMEQLGRWLKDCPNVYYITDTLSKVEVNSLIFLADVFISLHRAEGFGLVMAEAMIVGTPVIATNWSSNTEFMNPDVACMVDCTFTQLEKDSPPYKKGARWADPDIRMAAKYMRKLYKDREFYEKIRQSAQDYIKEKLSMEQAVNRIRKRIGEIYESFERDL